MMDPRADFNLSRVSSTSRTRFRSFALAWTSLLGGALHACQVGSQERYAFESGGTASNDSSSSSGAASTGGSAPSSTGGSSAQSVAVGEAGNNPGAGRNSGTGGAPPEPPASEPEGGSDAGAAGGPALQEPEGGAGGATDAQDLSGDPGTGGTPTLPACDAEEQVRCKGEARRERETCRARMWTDAASCPEDEVCDPRDGSCGTIAAACSGREPGARYCNNNTLVACSADLLSDIQTACSGACLESAGTADCAPESCGDGIEQAGEACDDGNATNGDGCSQTCAYEAVSVFAGGQQSCAISNAGALRCWGDNVTGELGLGDTRARGTKASDLGSALVGPDLGAHSVKQMALGRGHTCAILEDDTLRCWGSNDLGRLGHGDTTTRGDGAGEMGSALPITELGGSGKVSAVAAGETHSCALLSGGRVKCWGNNSSGQLGIGSTTARGGATGEMGDNLAAVDLGPGRTAKKVAVGVSHSCAVLDPDTLKCWGKNDRGQLGRGDVDARGDEASEMSMLTPIDLGPDVVVLDVAAGAVHTCALLKGGQIKCWGGNDLGQLGLGNTADRGDEPGEMGTALAAVNLGRDAVALTSGFNHTCALLDNRTVKCWGGNGLGQLGQGDTTHRGDAENELGIQLLAVNLGTGRTVRAVSAGWAHSCALLDDGSIRCWGNNASGQLGVGNTNSYGNAAGTLGDALPTVKLQF